MVEILSVKTPDLSILQREYVHYKIYSVEYEGGKKYLTLGSIYVDDDDVDRRDLMLNLRKKNGAMFVGVGKQDQWSYLGYHQFYPRIVCGIRPPIVTSNLYKYVCPFGYTIYRDSIEQGNYARISFRPDNSVPVEQPIDNLYKKMDPVHINLIEWDPYDISVLPLNIDSSELEVYDKINKKVYDLKEVDLLSNMSEEDYHSSEEENEKEEEEEEPLNTDSMPDTSSDRHLLHSFKLTTPPLQKQPIGFPELMDDRQERMSLRSMSDSLHASKSNALLLEKQRGDFYKAKYLNMIDRFNALGKTIIKPSLWVLSRDE
jgi:hypothetical protein